MTVDIRAFAIEDEDAVVALWEEARLTRPWNDPRADIRRKLTVQPELFLVAVDGGVVVGTVMAGYDGHRGWLYYLASAESHRGRGVGRALVAEAERLLEALGCPKVQLMVRPDNAECGPGGSRSHAESADRAPPGGAGSGQRLSEECAGRQHPPARYHSAEWSDARRAERVQGEDPRRSGERGPLGP
ncbi:GNAT family acetyltransferase, partial [Microbacterium sp. B19]|uniref:GNAT family acetyltransferase n=1 Tax=Microbacterium sp. B19 TaxID=96765 RepID=UPI0006843230